MIVQIFSFMAAVTGREHVVWVGEVLTQANLVDGIRAPHKDGTPADPETVNNRLFRYFNRVDRIDEERLELDGYKLPSLSAGDYITWQGQTYRVAGVGFERITGNPELLIRALI